MQQMIRAISRRAAATATLLVAATFAGTTSAHAQAGGIAVGTMVPKTLSSQTLDNAAFDFATVVGKQPVVMEFWATWCPLCRKLEPAMEAAKQKYGGRVMFVHVGVPENQSAERQRAYVQQKAMTGMFLFDQNNTLTKAFQVPHTSYVVVLDGTGKVVYTGVGAEQDIDAAVRKALPGS